MNISCDDDVLFFYNGVPIWGIVIGYNPMKDIYSLIVKGEKDSVKIKRSQIERVKKYIGDVWRLEKI